MCEGVRVRVGRVCVCVPSSKDEAEGEDALREDCD